MTVRHKRKIGKKRGDRTAGTGNTKNKRGSGSHMGNPHVKSKGGGARNFMHIVKFMPERLIRKGFCNQNAKKSKAINIGDLEKLTKEKEINLQEMGFSKLLGKGKPGKAMTIKVELFTKSAKEKVEKAGGKIIKIGDANNTSDDKAGIEA